MVFLQNEHLKVKISTLGAELVSVTDINNHEFIAQPSKQWIGQAKNLFPNVGILKDGYTIIDGKKYKLPQHGFAKDSEFSVIDSSSTSAKFRLIANEISAEVFPYNFILDISFYLKGNSLSQIYEIVNMDKKTMFFGIGSHTGFKVGSNDLDHYLQFFEDGKLHEMERPNMELLSGNIKSLELIDGKYDLDLPYKAARAGGDDAHILCNLKNKKIVLHDEDYMINISFNDFDYVTLWRLPGKPRFICIEPWCALPDSINSEHDFENKSGNLSLESGNKKKIEQNFTFTKEYK